MSKEITISNDVLTATISTLGAELQSIIKDGREIMWNGDPAFWNGRAPVLFPICGGLKDDKFIFKGKEYTLEKHGFARLKEFEVESTGVDTVTFLLKSDSETLKVYPFENELRITYTLLGNKLDVKYAVTNLTNDNMYFSIGAHEAYACPEGIEEYSVIFDEREDIRHTLNEGNLLVHKDTLILENTNEIPLKTEYFEIDALILLGLKSRKATLKHRKTGRCINLDFNGFDSFLIWTKPGAGYVCLEPWAGLPDFVDSDYDITHKPEILEAKAGETVVKTHIIEIE